MADHIRKQIRDEVVAKVTGLATTGSNVFAGRAMPLRQADLPGLLVYTNEESISTNDGRIGASATRLQVRDLEVLVRGYCMLTSGVDDQLDTIVKEVETAVLDGTMSKMAHIDLANISVEILDEGIEQVVGEVTLTFIAQYLCNDGAPTTLI